MKLNNGLEIQDDKIGEGKEVGVGDVLRIHYSGWLTDGESDLLSDWLLDNSKRKFDSSFDKNLPFEFPLGVGRVIPGWDTGVAGMKIGGKRTLIIPPELAYGMQGTPDGTIPANSTLKFQVELLGVVEPPKNEITEEKNGDGETIKAGDLLRFHFKLTQLEPSEQVIQNSKETGAPLAITLGAGQLPQYMEELFEGLNVGGNRTAILPEFPAEQRPKIEISIEILEKATPVKAWDLDNSTATALDSGLKYILVEEGKDAPFEDGEDATVHYSGFLEDGTKFDSSVDSGNPFTFKLGAGQVIRGWDEGVAQFNRGSKIRLILPPELGYGSQAAGSIPPNSTLIFDIEIL
jgi:peptidylprolyl isomerase